MMKRQLEKNKDNNINKKKRKIDGESELTQEQEIDLNEETERPNENEEIEETTRKKKGRTSWNVVISFSKYKLSGKANGATGNLGVHLRTKHPDKIPEDKKPVIEPFIFSQERYRESLVKWIVTSSKPFCTCEVDSFLEMIASLNPEAKTISKETVKRDIMKKFGEIVEQIKVKISKVSAKLSFTLDAWTSKNVLPFMAIRSHWINDDWEYETVLLDFCHIHGSHSGLNFSKIFLACLKRFEIPLSKVLGITIDNVSSNDTFMECLESHGIKVGTHISALKNRIRCMPHILNLCVQDILKSLKIPLSDEQDTSECLDEEDDDDDEEEDEEGNVDEHDNEEEDDEFCFVEEEEDEELEEEEAFEENQFTIPKLRKLIKKIRKSTQKREKLRKLCRLYKIKYRVPIIDVATRWNSTFLMIQRAIYLKSALRALCTNEKSLNKYITNEAEWSDLGILKELLQKFHRATNRMSMERHPTLSSYLPTLNWLQESLETFIEGSTEVLAQAVESGLEKLKKYQDLLQISKSRLPYIGVFLDPSVKMSYFKEHGYSKPLIKDIQKAITEMFEQTYVKEASNNSDDNSNEEPVDEFLLHMHKKAVNREPKELQKYMQFPLSGLKVNILEYWRSQKDEFPNLSKMARDNLAVQSSSVAVERDFSMGSDLVTPKRCSLLPETIRACLCLRSWIKNLNRPRQSPTDIVENQTSTSQTKTKKKTIK